LILRSRSSTSRFWLACCHIRLASIIIEEERHNGQEQFASSC
jgi:hypothetical protein